MNKIITIGREFGSGGRELARRLSEELKIAYYDKEILAEIAKRTDLSEQYVGNIVEKKPIFAYPIHVGRSFLSINTAQVIDSGTIFAEQAKILKELADKSDCIIVGRCADYVLRDYKPYRIFVYADTDSKVERCLAREQRIGGERTEKDIRKFLKNIDKNRADYYNFFTDQKWGDKLSYDLCINTSGQEIKDIVPHIAQMIK